MTIIVISTSDETGQHIAFSQYDPDMRVIGYGENDVIAEYVKKYHPEDVIIIDPRANPEESETP